MKTGGVIFRFILGLLLACGAMAALLYFSLPLDGDFLSGVFEEGPAGKLMEKTQDIWGAVLIGMNLVALAGLLICPKKGVPIFSAICGGLLLWALLVILSGKPFLAGLIQFGRMNSFLMISGGVVLVLLMYFLGSRSVPLVRAAEGLGNNFPRGIRIAEGLLVAIFAGAALYFALKTMRWYLPPAAILLALLPGTLCEWALAKRRSGVRLGYLCLRTLRGIGLVAFCPITVPVLLYALFSSRSR